VDTHQASDKHHQPVLTKLVAIYRPHQFLVGFKIVKVKHMDLIKQTKLQNIFLWVAALAFVLAVVFGAWSGYVYSQARITYENAQSVRDALRHFRTDQDAYPTTDQFQQRVLVPYYLSDMPKPRAIGKCSARAEFEYTQLTADNFKLQFCLPKTVAGLAPGLHEFTAEGLK
jgi:hypothetical protein